MNFGTPRKFSGQAFPQARHRHTDFLEQRLGYAVALVEKRGKKMFVGNFLIIGLRSKILRRLQGFLHFLRELIDAHASR